MRFAAVREEASLSSRGERQPEGDEQGSSANFPEQGCQVAGHVWVLATIELNRT
jgi:hypothetical protein